jgi:hypothetical protein
LHLPKGEKIKEKERKKEKKEMERRNKRNKGAPTTIIRPSLSF